ncbi:unnamed protein product [Fusarium fujikuroi]|nr:unnamed protein product [Fusarium fujikuroi]
MSKPAPRGIKKAIEAASLDATPALQPLPAVNFLDSMDKKLANAIVAEALPQDQDRFRRYLEHRPLGLGIITALARTRSSARRPPTLLDNFASRIDRRTREIAARCNKGNQTDTSRVKHKLVLYCDVWQAALAALAAFAGLAGLAGLAALVEWSCCDVWRAGPAVWLCRDVWQAGRAGRSSADENDWP